MEYTPDIEDAIIGCLANSRKGSESTIISTDHIEDPAISRSMKTVLTRLGGRAQNKEHEFPAYIPIAPLLSGIIHHKYLPGTNFLEYPVTSPGLSQVMWDAVTPNMRQDSKLSIAFPNAGVGWILEFVHNVKFGRMVATENDPLRYIFMETHYQKVKGLKLLRADFSRACVFDEPFDLVMGNFPLKDGNTKLAYVRQIWMALEKLKRGGQLIAVVPGDFMSSRVKQVVSLREHLKSVSRFTELPNSVIESPSSKGVHYLIEAWKLSGSIGNNNSSIHFKEALEIVRSKFGSKAA